MTCTHLTARAEADTLQTFVRGMTATQFAAFMDTNWGLWNEPQRTCIRAMHRFANLTTLDELEAACEAWERNCARILDRDDVSYLTTELFIVADAMYEVAMRDDTFDAAP